MKKKYTVLENPLPGTTGPSHYTEIDVEEGSSFTERIINNRLVNVPNYTIVTKPRPKPDTVINSTVINQSITVLGSSSDLEISAMYFNLSAMQNKIGKFQLINDGLGEGTYDDNGVAIWDTIVNELIVNEIKTVYDVQLCFEITTDTLGGTFEVSAETGSSKVVDVIEEDINIQNQDYTIRFKLIGNQDMVDTQVRFYIKPELGMKVSLSNFKLVIVRG